MSDSVIPIRRIVISASFEPRHEPVEPISKESAEPPFSAEKPHHTRTYRVVAANEQPSGAGRRELLVAEAAERPDLGAVVAAVYRGRDIAAAGSEVGAVQKDCGFVHVDVFRKFCFCQVGTITKSKISDFSYAVR